MNHDDHVGLLRPANLRPGGVWADLGAGSGAFTLALRELVGAEAEIHAVDKDAASLAQLEQAFARRFGDTSRLHLVHADFEAFLVLPILDGIVMANSLHFVRFKDPIVRHAYNMLKPGGMLLLVEYNVESGNAWVPYPLSFERFQKLAVRFELSRPRLLATRPSSFLHEIYSAEALRPELPQT